MYHFWTAVHFVCSRFHCFQTRFTTAPSIQTLRSQQLLRHCLIEVAHEILLLWQWQASDTASCKYTWLLIDPFSRPLKHFTLDPPIIQRMALTFRSKSVICGKGTIFPWKLILKRVAFKRFSKDQSRNLVSRLLSEHLEGKTSTFGNKISTHSYLIANHIPMTSRCPLHRPLQQDKLRPWAAPATKNVLRVGRGFRYHQFLGLNLNLRAKRVSWWARLSSEKHAKMRPACFHLRGEILGTISTL